MTNDKYKWICGTIVLCVFLIMSALIIISTTEHKIRIEANEEFTEALKVFEDFEVHQTEIQTENFYSDFGECESVPCECWEWGCALYCMECGNKNSEENELRFWWNNGTGRVKKNE